MTRRSWRGVVIGACIALVLPISYRVLAALVEAGLVQFERTDAVFGVIWNVELSAIVAILLGLLGLRIVGRATGIRNSIAWFALVIVGLPVLLVAWFIGFATFGGAMGSPF
ncbi:MAG: hypothetical protein V4515_01140 [Chloroflexota bacterium]